MDTASSTASRRAKSVEGVHNVGFCLTECCTSMRYRPHCNRFLSTSKMDRRNRTHGSRPTESWRHRRITASTRCVRNRHAKTGLPLHQQISSKTCQTSWRPRDCKLHKQMHRKTAASIGAAPASYLDAKTISPSKWLPGKMSIVFTSTEEEN